ncbi:MAG: hypothetical protein KGN79_00150 [Acidobacteriota bacterium]|nr:hypothetical protein [Acidobacteriota bacterium]
MMVSLCPAAEWRTDDGLFTDARFDPTKRNFLRAAGLLAAGMMVPQLKGQRRNEGTGRDGPKVVVVIVGGVRRAETFSHEGLENIPHLVNDLLPQSRFYLHTQNLGVTAHFNAISSILTGNWQRVDDWGKYAPTTPTMFEQFRKGLHAGRSDTWIVASNKALTNMIGASSANGYGPEYGANVVFPKQLMLMAVEEALRSGRTANMADRARVEAELQRALEGSNYEGLGWNVFDAADQIDPRVRGTIESAIAGFVHSGGPTSGDELTFFMTREVMRKFAPNMVVVALSDVEAAHFGCYSMHLSGIRTADRITLQLWQEVQSNPDYRNKTTMIVLPEFGRDPDGSSTNGFFNHRANEASTRDTWMMTLGAGVEKPEIVERPVHHIDLCPTVADLLGYKAVASQGVGLKEFRA